MGFKLFLVFGCLITLATSVIFEECGGYGFKITSVDVEGCSKFSCKIPVGTSRTITVSSVNEVTNFATLHSRAFITYMGHSWELLVTPNDICLHWGGCPLGESTTRTYSGDVTFNNTLLRRPGYLSLSAKYETEADDSVAFCIRIYVELV